MARKTTFVNKMILKTLNQHQQTVPSAVQKVATLDDEVGEIINRKKSRQGQITPTGNLSPVVTQTTSLSMYSNEPILETVPKNTRHERKTCYVSLDKTENYIGKTSVVSRSRNHGQ